MQLYWNSVYNALIDLPPAVLIGVLFLSLALAMVVSGIFTLMKKRVADTQMLLTVLIMASLAISAAMGIGYERFAREQTKYPPGFTIRNPNQPRNQNNARGGQRIGSNTFFARRIMELADTDKDGRLSTEEASHAASEFIHSVSRGDHDSIDSRVLGNSIRSILYRPPGARIGPNGLAASPQDPGVFDEFDRNKDGKLSRDEFPEVSRGHFDALDVNKDGVITRDENLISS
ncbi:EF-hand domain-containing protein [Singulisphaera rosea]